MVSPQVSARRVSKYNMSDNTPLERDAHNQIYASQISDIPFDTASFQQEFVKINASHFKDGGSTKGLVRGIALRKLILDLKERGISPSHSQILDAGCGQGDLSLFLASLGFKVIAVDLSDVAIARLRKKAEALDLADRITGQVCSLESIPINEGSVDAIIGFASLHHFIKYEDVSAELHRVLRPGGRAYFADSFGENRLYNIFHDREKMETLGDVTLTRERIEAFFKTGFRTTLYPTDWFSMLDKLYDRFVPPSAQKALRTLSALHYGLDRCVPMSNSKALWLSGAVLTQVEKAQETGGAQIGHLRVADVMRQDPRNMIKT